MKYQVTHNKILTIFYIFLLLVFSIQCTDALVSNAKIKQLADQEEAKKEEAKKLEQQQQKQEQENESNKNDDQTSNIDSTITKYEKNKNNTNNIDQVIFCATQDYEKTKMRGEISKLQENNILLQEQNKKNTSLASANFDLEKSKLRENNRIESIKKDELANSTIKAFVELDNNISQERNNKIWYRKAFTTQENYNN